MRCFVQVAGSKYCLTAINNKGERNSFFVDRMLWNKYKRGEIEISELDINEEQKQFLNDTGNRK